MPFIKRNEWIVGGALMLLPLFSNAQKVVRYDLYVQDTLVNYSGKERRAIAVNGQIPMPTLTFTEGDIAEIYVHNQLKENTALHWHGIFLPNREDGVPYLTQMPIEPGKTHKYTFPIIQNGTYWYHSHSGLQEQIGMHGSMVLKKKPDDKTFRKGIDDLPEVPLILSEWTDLKPENVHRMLHHADDWFAIKKGATQSYSEAIKAGHLKTKLKNEWKRMAAMDVSDVYYEQFQINGQHQSSFSQFKGGDKVRLRIANGGASTYFWLTYAGGKITVVGNDGNDVEPIEVDRLMIATAETYDVIITIPDDGIAYEFLATPEDRSDDTSVFFGKGKKQLTSRLPKLKYFEGMKMMNDMMKMDGSMHSMGMDMSLQTMDMNAVMYPEITGPPASKKKPTPKKADEHAHHTIDAGKANTSMPNEHSEHGASSTDLVTLNYGMLKAPHSTVLPKEAPVRELRFELTGNMNRYLWSMDNKVISEADKIKVKKGEVLRITLYNGSMMRHPMHLHGHDFRLINQHGDYSPLKNTMDIMPMETNVIEFEANAEGDWFFHCHILYHMMAGMGRIFSYEDQEPNPLIPNPKHAQRMLYADDRMFHAMGENDFASNGLDGMFSLQNTRWGLTTEWSVGYNKEHGYEVETHLGRYIGTMQWFMPFIGFDWRYRKMGHNEVEKNMFGQKNTKDDRALFSAGFVYTLPWMVQLQSEVYHDGTFRMQLMREDIPLTPRVRGGFMVNTDKEYMVDLRYILTRQLSARTHYDSDMGFGVGIVLKY